MRQRRFDSPARRVPSDPHGYYLEEIAFQLEVAGVALTEDVRLEITSYYIAGVSPVGAVALMLAIPRDDSPDLPEGETSEFDPRDSDFT